MLNKVQLIWNITQDIEMKQTPNWQNVVSTSIATNEKYTDKGWQKVEKAEFHNIVLWGKTAELISKYVKKGDKIYVEWKLTTRSWEVDDWTKRYRTEIVVNNIIFLWGKKNDNTAQSQPNVKKETRNDEISIEDVPF